jgi:uncharacterized protein YifE (UPF0438 family)
MENQNYQNENENVLEKYGRNLVELAKNKKTKLTKNEKECLNKYGYYLPESLE